MPENRWAGSEAEAIQALEAFVGALNAGDNQVLFDTMHLPRRADIRRRSTAMALAMEE